MSVKYISCKLCSEHAKLPAKKYDGDAGWDLFVSADVDIPPNEMVDVHTDVRIDMPPRTYARLVGRSSTMRTHGLLVNEGIIDNGYTGELFISIRNMSNKVFHVKRGMRLAQVLFHTMPDVRWSQVDEIPDRPNSRNENGYGSTGVSEVE